MALPRNVVPFDSGEPAGPTAPMPSEAELRALIEELKNTNPGALAKGPPKRKERIPGLQAVLTKASSAAGAAPSRSSGAPPARAGGERLPGLQAMVSKVSATPQGTRIPGLGFVKDPTDDGPDGEPDSDSDDRAPAGPPARSADPFSQAAKQMYPLGMKNRHIGALGAMAASVVPGVGPFVAGALGGLGSYGLTTEDQDLDATSAGLSAATGGMGGMLLGKVLPPVAKAIGSRLPNFTNDAKVAAEFGNDLARGVAGPGEALSSRGVTPGPAAPPPQLGQGQPLALPQGPRATIVSSEPLSGSSPALGWQSSPGMQPGAPALPPSSSPMQLGPGAQPQLGPGTPSGPSPLRAPTLPSRPELDPINGWRHWGWPRKSPVNEMRGGLDELMDFINGRSSPVRRSDVLGSAGSQSARVPLSGGSRGSFDFGPSQQRGFSGVGYEEYLANEVPTMANSMPGLARPNSMNGAFLGPAQRPAAAGAELAAGMRPPPRAGTSGLIQNQPVMGGAPPPAPLPARPLTPVMPRNMASFPGTDPSLLGSGPKPFPSGQTLNMRTPVAPSPSPAAPSMGAPPVNYSNLSELWAAGGAGDPVAVATLSGMGLLGGAAAGFGGQRLLRPDAAPRGASAGGLQMAPPPFAVPRPYATQREDRLQPVGVKALQGKGGPPPRKKKPKK